MLGPNWLSLGCSYASLPPHYKFIGLCFGDSREIWSQLPFLPPGCDSTKFYELLAEAMGSLRHVRQTDILHVGLSLILNFSSRAPLGHCASGSWQGQEGVAREYWSHKASKKYIYHSSQPPPHLSTHKHMPFSQVCPLQGCFNCIGRWSVREKTKPARQPVPTSSYQSIFSCFACLDGVTAPFQNNHQWHDTECLWLTQENQEKKSTNLFKLPYKVFWKKKKEKKNVTQWQAKGLLNKSSIKVVQIG